MSDQQLRSRIEALPNMAIADLKLMWWTLYDTKIPKFNRTFLEQQLAYRLQEIACGSLSDKATETLHLLRARKSLSQKRKGKKPPAGVLLIKEYRGVEHWVWARRGDGAWTQCGHSPLLAELANVVEGVRVS